MDGCILFTPPFEMIIFIWRSRHCRRRTAKCWSLIGANDLSARIFIVPHLLGQRTSVFVVSSEGQTYLVVDSRGTEGVYLAHPHWATYSAIMVYTCGKLSIKNWKFNFVVLSQILDFHSSIIKFAIQIFRTIFTLYMTSAETY